MDRCWNGFDFSSLTGPKLYPPKIFFLNSFHTSAWCIARFGLEPSPLHTLHCRHRAGCCPEFSVDFQSYTLRHSPTTCRCSSADASTSAVCAIVLISGLTVACIKLLLTTYLLINDVDRYRKIGSDCMLKTQFKWFCSSYMLAKMNTKLLGRCVVVESVSGGFK